MLVCKSLDATHRLAGLEALFHLADAAVHNGLFRVLPPRDAGAVQLHRSSEMWRAHLEAWHREARSPRGGISIGCGGFPLVHKFSRLFVDFLTAFPR